MEYTYLNKSEQGSQNHELKHNIVRFDDLLPPLRVTSHLDHILARLSWFVVQDQRSKRCELFCVLVFGCS